MLSICSEFTTNVLFILDLHAIDKGLYQKLMKRKRDFEVRKKGLSLVCSKAVRSKDGSKISVQENREWPLGRL